MAPTWCSATASPAASRPARCPGRIATSAARSSTSVIRRFFGTRIGDSQSGLRAFRQALPSGSACASGGMELASEMIVSAARRRARRSPRCPRRTASGSARASSTPSATAGATSASCSLAAPDFLFILPGCGADRARRDRHRHHRWPAPGGIEIGPLTWRPVFAGTILLAIGANALLFGVIAKLFGVSPWPRWPRTEWSRLYRRWFRLEVVLALAALLFVTGIRARAALFGAWTTNAVRSTGSSSRRSPRP